MHIGFWTGNFFGNSHLTGREGDRRLTLR